jgi:anti-sigma B factor antagonist
MTDSPRAESHYVLEGRYDALRSTELDRRLQELYDRGAKTIVLDLGQVTYISSSSLRVLLMAHRRAVGVGGRVVLANTPERILRLFRMAGFDRVFDLHSS